MSLAGFLSSVVRFVDAASIPHMVTGSLASAYYGTPRATQDVDLALASIEDLVVATLVRTPLA